MAYNIKMLKGNQASLPATPRDANSVYFTVDGGNIYLGDKLLTGKVSFTKPATGVEGTIYVDTNGIPFVWDTETSAYKQMLPQMPAALTASGASQYKLATEKAVIDYITANVATSEGFAQLQEDVDALETTVGQHTTDIASLKSGKADKATTLAGYGISDAYTKGETDSAISAAVAASQHLTKVVLGDSEELPDATEATDNAIYLKKITGGSGDQYYEEFIVINDKWEKIGDTKVDLSNYATQSWVTSQISPVSSKADANEAAIGVINGSGAGSIKKALQDAKDYADSLASNYATAAQGTKADTALQKADVTEGGTNGTIAVKGTDVPVHGLGSAAYSNTSAFDAAGAATAAETRAKSYADSLASNYATAAQGTKADSALQKADIVESSTNGAISVKGTDVAIHGLKSAAYTNSSAYDPAGSASTAETNAKSYTDTALTWGTF